MVGLTSTDRSLAAGGRCAPLVGAAAGTEPRWAVWREDPA